MLIPLTSIQMSELLLISILTDLQCNQTVEALLSTSVTINCRLSNVDTSYMQTVAVTKDGSQLFNVSDNYGVVVTTNGYTTLTYSYTIIQLYLAPIMCDHDGVYTFSVNNDLQYSTTLVATSK